MASLGVMPNASAPCVCSAQIAAHSAAPDSITMYFKIASVMAESNAPPSTGCGLGVSEIPAVGACRFGLDDPCQRADAGQQLHDAGNGPAGPILPPMKGLATGIISVGNADDLATSQRHEIDVAISVAAAGPRRR